MHLAPIGDLPEPAVIILWCVAAVCIVWAFAYLVNVIFGGFSWRGQPSSNTLPTGNPFPFSPQSLIVGIVALIVLVWFLTYIL